jgi:hypothetical protein
LEAEIRKQKFGVSSDEAEEMQSEDYSRKRVSV